MESRCYTTGAYIEPVRDTDGKYRWQVVRFNEGAYDEFGNRFDPEIVANTALGLLNGFDIEEKNNEQ